MKCPIHNLEMHYFKLTDLHACQVPACMLARGVSEKSVDPFERENKRRTKANHLTTGATMNRTQTMNRVDKVRLIIEQEVMDGCNECKNGGACTTHHLFFLELAINPRKYIDLDRCKLRDGVEVKTVRQASIRQ